MFAALEVTFECYFAVLCIIHLESFSFLWPFPSSPSDHFLSIFQPIYVAFCLCYIKMFWGVSVLWYVNLIKLRDIPPHSITWQRHIMDWIIIMVQWHDSMLLSCDAVGQSFMNLHEVYLSQYRKIYFTFRQLAINSIWHVLSTLNPFHYWGDLEPLFQTLMYGLFIKNTSTLINTCIWSNAQEHTC